MKKKEDDDELPKGLQEFLCVKTNIEAEIVLKDVDNLINEIQNEVRKQSIEKAKLLKSSGKTIKEISSQLGVSISTVHRYLKK